MYTMYTHNKHHQNVKDVKGEVKGEAGIIQVVKENQVKRVRRDKLVLVISMRLMQE
jgi:hypothetical protein